MEEEQFPIVDISRFIENQQEDKVILRETAQELLKGFSEWGFIYLKGHFIPEEIVEQMFKLSEKFFKQPLEEKRKVLISTKDPDNIIGYIPFKMETFDVTKPFDLKEAFHYMHHINSEMKENLSNEFLDPFKILFNKCSELTFHLLTLLTDALHIKDEKFLQNSHEKLGYLGNGTILRALFYPPVEKKTVLQDQTRCGEHSDYGTFTLLFQNANGLEVNNLKSKTFSGNHEVCLEVLTVLTSF